MHRFIMDAKKGDIIDHVNGDPLDNRFKNLRKCTVSQNAKNRSINKNNTSGYKGVVWHLQVCKWQSRIYVDGKWKSLGIFDDKMKAAKAYNKAAKVHYGKFAKLNTF